MASPPRFDAAFRTDLAALFAWRRDVRRFSAEKLPEGTLEDLLDLAMLAPSVGLSQPWRFVSVADTTRREGVRANFRNCNARALACQQGERAARYAGLKLAGLDEAPCQFAVFNEDKPTQGGGLGRATIPETTAYSTVMAVHTLWLAARAAGLGLGWVSILDPEPLNALLDVPRHWRFIGYFCLGVPSAEDDTPELERLGWECRRSSADHHLLR